MSPPLPGPPLDGGDGGGGGEDSLSLLAGAATTARPPVRTCGDNMDTDFSGSSVNSSLSSDVGGGRRDPQTQQQQQQAGTAPMQAQQPRVTFRQEQQQQQATEDVPDSNDNALSTANLLRHNNAQLSTEQFIEQLIRAQTMANQRLARRQQRQVQVQQQQHQEQQQQHPLFRQQPDHIPQPSSTIFLCRARGLPPEHRAKNSHFTISPETKHGDGLVCSFPLCRNGGIKFVYCGVCKAPVARRSFRTSHIHESELRTQKESQEPNENELPIGKKKLEQRSHKPGSQETDTRALGRQESSQQDQEYNSDSESRNSSEGSENSSVDDDDENDNVPANDDPIRANNNDNHTSTTAHLIPESSSTTTNETRKRKQASQDHERMRRWIELLGQRPSAGDDDRMSQWLMNVMATSEP